MKEYTTNTTAAEIAEQIRSARRIAITTHSKPDGDAVGSTIALKRVLDGMQKKADIFLMGPVEPALVEVMNPTPFTLVKDDAGLDPGGNPGVDYDLVMVLDTGSWSQLEPLEEWLRPQREQVIVIDHHVRGDDIAALRLVEPGCAAATQVLHPVLKELGGVITGERGGVGEALFVGVATDTGWFRFPNADAEAFSFAARLLESGVDKSRLFEMIEATARPERLRVQARALGSVEYIGEGAYALMILTTEDFRETGGEPEDLTNLVNAPLCVESVRASILLTEREPGVTKMSFRSKPRTEGRIFVDVNVLAQNFGGGGHTHAAGARMKKGMEEVRAELVRLLGVSHEP